MISEKHYFVIILSLMLIVFSCKKEVPEEESKPLDNPGEMGMIFTKTDVVCYGGNDGSIDISVAGGAGPYSYAWSNGSSEEDLTGLSAGSYIVNVLDNKGYTLIDTFVVEQPAPIIINETIYPDLLDISISGGTPPYSYLWSNGDTTQDFYDYNQLECSVMVSDANDCSVSKDFLPFYIDDGTYIVGDGIGVSGLQENGLMHIARNEVTQEDRLELFDKYLAVEGGSQGFNIIEKDGANQITFGPGNDFAYVPESELNNDEPKAGLWRGSLIETNEPFTVPDDGLYHIAYDKELMIVVIAKVEWGIIGAATPGGWTSSTVLPSGGFNLNSLTFEASNVPLTNNDYKFRYSDGWKVILDEDFDLGNGLYGIKVNSNLGGIIDDLVPGGYNLSIEELGIYTISITWDLENAYVASMIKTGDLPTTDYTDTELGLIGDGLMVNGVQHNWIETIMLHVPVVQNETNYTWTYSNVEVTTLGSFKIREGQTWDNLNLGYYDVTMAGSAANDFEGIGGGNFVPLVNGFYNIELFVDAVTEDFTFTVDFAK